MYFEEGGVEAGVAEARYQHFKNKKLQIIKAINNYAEENESMYPGFKRHSLYLTEVPTL